jgi:hypothetical protein
MGVPLRNVCVNVFGRISAVSAYCDAASNVEEKDKFQFFSSLRKENGEEKKFCRKRLGVQHLGRDSQKLNSILNNLGII